MIENTEQNERTHIEKNVMRRVHLVRILGLIISTVALAFVTFVLALWGIGKNVWVARVFENIPESSDLVGISNFFLSAFGHTRFLVQLLTVICFVALAYLIRETYRMLVRFLSSSKS